MSTTKKLAFVSLVLLLLVLAGSTFVYRKTTHYWPSFSVNLHSDSVQAQTVYFRDTFTGTAGTSLISHTPDVGGSWTLHPSSSSGGGVLTNANRFRCATPNFQFIALNGTAPSGTTYTQTWDMVPLGNFLSNASFSGVTGTATGVFCNYSATVRTGYECQYSSVNGNIGFTFGKVVTGTTTVLQSISYTLTAGHIYSCELDTTPTGHVFKVSDNGAAATTVFTDTDTTYTAMAGYTGLIATFAQSDTDGLHMDNYVASVPTGTALAAIATISNSQASITPGVTMSGGTAPYTINYYRSTTPNFTPGAGTRIATHTGISASSDTFPDTIPTVGTVYDYIMVVSDSAGTTATVQPLFIPGSRLPATLVIGALGDSVSAGATLTAAQAAPIQMGYYLQHLGPWKTVVVNNQAIGGKSAGDFSPSLSLYQGAETAWDALSAKPTVFHLCFGLNDSNYLHNDSAATFFANEKAIIDRLLLHFPGCKVIISAPTFTYALTYTLPTGPLSQFDLLQSYPAAIVSLAASYATSNPNKVFVGDTAAYAFFAANYTTELTLETTTTNFWIHPNAQGAQDLGQFWALAVYKALYPSVVARPIKGGPVHK